MKQTMFVVTLAILSVLIVSSMSDATTYNITDIGTNLSADSAPNDINDRGQIIVLSYLNSEPVRSDGFIWTDGSYRQLPTLPGYTGHCYPTAINNNGGIIGFCEDRFLPLATTYWNSLGEVTDISNQLPGGMATIDINDSGSIVGGTTTSSYVYNLFDHSVRFLALGEYTESRADCINNGGVVGGTLDKYNHPPVACIWDAQGNILSEIDPPNSNGGYISDINDSNAAVGSIGIPYYNSINHAFYWDQSIGLIDIGALIENEGFSSSATGINAYGQVVGNTWDSYTGQYHSLFTWSLSEGIQELPIPTGATGCYAEAINDSGWIVGGFKDPVTNYYHAVLWQPVPEPSSLLALCGGVVGILVFRQRRQ